MTYTVDSCCIELAQVEISDEPKLFNSPFIFLVKSMYFTRLKSKFDVSKFRLSQTKLSASL